METTYFLDTYALVEIIKKNGSFNKFQATSNFTGLMNLLELHHQIMKNFNEQTADEITEKLKSIVIDIAINDIKEASKFRIKNSKRKFSYIDCLGYNMALNRKMMFVTGDQQFKDFADVEFIK